MVLQLTTLSVVLLLLASVTILFAVYIGIKRTSNTYQIGIVLLISAAIWMIAHIFLEMSREMWSVYLWLKVQFIGICILPVAWLAYTMKFIGRVKFLTRRNLALFSIIPFITLILTFSNEFHGLIFKSFKTVIGSHRLRVDTFGIGLWIFIIYSYIMVFTGIFLLIQALIRSGKLYRWQASALLITVLIPWITNILEEVLNYNFIPNTSTTPIALGVTTPLIAWSLYRLRLKDIVPIARDMIIENMGDVVIVLDNGDRIVDINAAARQLFGQTERLEKGEHVTSLWPNWHEWTSMEHHSSSAQEVKMTFGNEEHIYDLLTTPLTDWRGNIMGKIIVLRDITNHKRAAEQIKQQLREKEILLKEIHHRVKNNFQVVLSLLNLQERTIKDKDCCDILTEPKNRIRAMALIHEMLYKSDDFTQVDFTRYLKRMITDLFSTYSHNRPGVQYHVEAGPVVLNITQAIPCGLIINELITNALKHAFPPEWSVGVIRIRINESDDNVITVCVSDNGIGMPVEIDTSNTQTIGLQIIHLLAKQQLKGDFKLDGTEGTTVTITFKKK